MASGKVISMSVSVLRMGKWVVADEVFEAWGSGDLTRMLAALTISTNPIDRHFLLLGIVRATYKQRSNPGMRGLCIQVANQHLSECGEILPALRINSGGFLPSVPTFQHLATVLAEDGEHEAAIKVCEQALSYGLKDGTKGGFEGRIDRIRKSAAR
jgi:hypothetical protein